MEPISILVGLYFYGRHVQKKKQKALLASQKAVQATVIIEESKPPQAVCKYCKEPITDARACQRCGAPVRYAEAPKPRELTYAEKKAQMVMRVKGTKSFSEQVRIMKEFAIENKKKK